MASLFWIPWNRIIGQDLDRHDFHVVIYDTKGESD